MVTVSTLSGIFKLSQAGIPDNYIVVNSVKNVIEDGTSTIVVLPRGSIYLNDSLLTLPDGFNKLSEVIETL